MRRQGRAARPRSSAPAVGGAFGHMYMWRVASRVGECALRGGVECRSGRDRVFMAWDTGVRCGAPGRGIHPQLRARLSRATSAAALRRSAHDEGDCRVTPRHVYADVTKYTFTQVLVRQNTLPITPFRSGSRSALRSFWFLETGLRCRPAALHTTRSAIATPASRRPG